MLTYLTIGMAVEVAWFIYCIIRKMPPVTDLEGFGAWFGYVVGCIPCVIIWPIAIIGYVVVSYNQN